MSKPAIKSRAPQPTIPLSAGWRAILSALLAFHVVALFVAPWSNPPPSSQLSQEIAQHFRWYNNATHTLNGYRFFAPSPGPSHLVEYDLTFADGSHRTGRFPNLSEQFPRLLYHRYFMLAERLNVMYVPPEPPPNLPPADLTNYREQRKLYQLHVDGFAQQLLREHAAVRVKMRLLEHNFASPENVLAKWELSDERLFARPLELGEFSLPTHP